MIFLINFKVFFSKPFKMFHILGFPVQASVLPQQEKNHLFSFFRSILPKLFGQTEMNEEVPC